MRISVIQGSITEVKGDIAIVNLFLGVRLPGGATGAVDRVLGGAISSAIASSKFKGELGETIILSASGKLGANRVLVVGLGLPAQFGYKEVEIASYSATKTAIETNAAKISTIVHGGGVGGLDIDEAAKALVKGSLKAFEENRAKVGAVREPPLLQVVEFNPEKVKAIESILKTCLKGGR